MKTITVKVSDELFAKLDLFAMNNWMSRSDVIREALECYLNGNCLTSSPPWKGRGFPSRVFIVPTIGSGLHPSFGGQSSGSENHSHLKMGLSLPSSSPLKEKEDDSCPSRSPIKPSIEPGRSVVSITKRNFDKGVFKLSIRGLSIPALKGEAFRPLNPHFL